MAPMSSLLADFTVNTFIAANANHSLEVGCLFGRFNTAFQSLKGYISAVSLQTSIPGFTTLKRLTVFLHEPAVRKNWIRLSAMSSIGYPYRIEVACSEVVMQYEKDASLCK